MLIKSYKVKSKSQCRYCKNFKHAYSGDKGSLSLLNEYMEVVIEDKECATFKINYCPMCGKRVNDYKLFE